MSLFICSSCGAIENTACVRPGTNPDYPNLWLSDMQAVPFEGQTNTQVRMLCSECNTGVWHGEFDKVYPTPDERRIASFSKYGMITPHDHNPNLIRKDNNAPHGYRSATDDEIMESFTSGRETARHNAVGYFENVIASLNLPLDIQPIDRVSRQSEQEANAAKEKAELKRQLKAAKKQMNHANVR